MLTFRAYADWIEIMRGKCLVISDPDSLPDRGAWISFLIIGARIPLTRH
jgi:hypothetical protein